MLRASPPFEPDISEVANAGGVRVVAVAEHGYIDHVRGCRILPDLGIDARQVDPLVEPAVDPIVASVGNKMREASDVFVVSRSQPIAPDHLHRALPAAVGHEAKKKPRRVIIAFARALIKRAANREFDVPAPNEQRIGGKIDVDVTKQHRRAVMGFEPHARHSVLYGEGHAHRRSCPEFTMSPAKGERIEREALSKIHHGHDRPAIGSQYLAPPIEELPADYAGDSAERDRANQEVSSSQGILGRPDVAIVLAELGLRHVRSFWPMLLRHPRPSFKSEVG